MNSNIRTNQVTDDMVLRFLCWKLPQHFYPDCYISFDREKASQSPNSWPTGTNLLDADQSRKMLEHVLQSQGTTDPKVAADFAMLRAALVGLIGADTEAELKQMEAAMRLLPAPEADKAVSINAIHALLATMPVAAD